MPCPTYVRQNQTAVERQAEIQETLARLEQSIVSGRVTAIVGQQGAVTLSGWSKADRAGVTDVCALQRLRQTGSAAMLHALQVAEQRAGRQVDWQAIAAGVHSHDGGRTWSAH